MVQLNTDDMLAIKILRMIAKGKEPKEIQEGIIGELAAISLEESSEERKERVKAFLLGQETAEENRESEKALCEFFINGVSQRIIGMLDSDDEKTIAQALKYYQGLKLAKSAPANRDKLLIPVEKKLAAKMIAMANSRIDKGGIKNFNEALRYAQLAANAIGVIPDENNIQDIQNDLNALIERIEGKIKRFQKRISEM